MKPDPYLGEKLGLYQVTYSWIDYGDGIRCAWCKKKVDEIIDLEEHLKKHYAS